jgi:hypothetical protein
VVELVGYIGENFDDDWIYFLPHGCVFMTSDICFHRLVLIWFSQKKLYCFKEESTVYIPGFSWLEFLFKNNLHGLKVLKRP